MMAEPPTVPRPPDTHPTTRSTLPAAVARLRGLIADCERDDTGDGVMETPLEQARQLGADLRVVLGALNHPAQPAVAVDTLPPSKERQRRYEEVSHVADVILEAYGYGDEVLAGVDMQSLRTATAIVDYIDAHPASVPPDTQSVAPTRDELDSRVRAALTLAASKVPDGHPLPRGRWITEATPRIVALIVELLSGGGADGGGEDEAGRYPGIRLTRDSLRIHAEALTENLNAALREKRQARADLARLAAAAGVSPDSEDVVGAIEAAIRAGREPEVVSGVEAAELPISSWAIPCSDDGRPIHDEAAPIRRLETTPAGTHAWDRLGEKVTLSDTALVRVLYRAPGPAPASLTVGDVVSGDRAVSAPVGTTLGAKNAATAAVHTVNGWSVTGMSREQDHEEHVRLNEWVVFALPGYAS